MDHLKKKYDPELNLGNSEFQVEGFKKNQIVFSEGARAYDAYLLKKGRIEISVKVEGKKVVLTTLSDKTVFGEMALVLKAHRRTATAMAVEDCEVVKIPKDTFDKYINASPRLISTCLLTIAGRLQDTTIKASKSPDSFVGVSQILNLLFMHDRLSIFYNDTVDAITEALLKEKSEIMEVLALMEDLNLIELKKPENGKKMIQRVGGDRFLEKSVKVFNVLKRYQGTHKL